MTLHALEAIVASRAGRLSDAASHLAAARQLAREQQDEEAETDADLIESWWAVEAGRRARAVEVRSHPHRHRSARIPEATAWRHRWTVRRGALLSPPVRAVD